ncbi:MAG: hypothetical protein CMJ39_00475 [Phycisphaerae bacterium]|nr:hypothetical protein [Phycisphaerae bacterium]
MPPKRLISKQRSKNLEKKKEVRNLIKKWGFLYLWNNSLQIRNITIPPRRLVSSIATKMIIDKLREIPKLNLPKRVTPRNIIDIGKARQAGTPLQDAINAVLKKRKSTTPSEFKIPAKRLKEYDSSDFKSEVDYEEARQMSYDSSSPEPSSDEDNSSSGESETRQKMPVDSSLFDDFKLKADYEEAWKRQISYDSSSPGDSSDESSSGESETPKNVTWAPKRYTKGGAVFAKNQITKRLAIPSRRKRRRKRLRVVPDNEREVFKTALINIYGTNKKLTPQDIDKIVKRKMKYGLKIRLPKKKDNVNLYERAITHVALKSSTDLQREVEAIREQEKEVLSRVNAFKKFLKKNEFSEERFQAALKEYNLQDTSEARKMVKQFIKEDGLTMEQAVNEYKLFKQELSALKGVKEYTGQMKNSQIPKDMLALFGAKKKRKGSKQKRNESRNDLESDKDYVTRLLALLQNGPITNLNVIQEFNLSAVDQTKQITQLKAILTEMRKDSESNRDYVTRLLTLLNDRPITNQNVIEEFGLSTFNKETQEMQLKAILNFLKATTDLKKTTEEKKYAILKKLLDDAVNQYKTSNNTYILDKTKEFIIKKLGSDFIFDNLGVVDQDTRFVTFISTQDLLNILKKKVATVTDHIDDGLHAIGIQSDSDTDHGESTEVQEDTDDDQGLTDVQGDPVTDQFRSLRLRF